MDIGDIVSVSISANTRTPTRAGFGTPLLMTYHTNFTDLVREYEDLTDLVSDGFAATSPTYYMAQALLSQNPRPESFKVGRLPAAFTQTQTLVMTSATQGDVVSFTILDSNGTATDISYTILGSETTSTVATAVELLIEAATAGSATTSAASTATITVTGAAGEMIYFSNLSSNITYTDTTIDANYDDALTALQVVDDDWYFVLTDINSEANSDLIAAWAETRTKHYVYQTMNTLEKSAGTLFSGMDSNAYDRSVGLFVENAEEYGACAWVGVMAPKDPGSATWKFKSLTGVTASNLTTTQESYLEGLNANFYTEIAGIGVTTEGVAASGEFVDIQHGIDWLTARIQERLFGIIAGADKVPYTDAAVDSLLNEIISVMEIGVDRNFLVTGTLTATAPKVADIDVADRAARLLPDVKFGATLAGAIHKTVLVGTLTV